MGTQWHKLLNDKENLSESLLGKLNEAWESSTSMTSFCNAAGELIARHRAVVNSILLWLAQNVSIATPQIVLPGGNTKGRV